MHRARRLLRKSLGKTLGDVLADTFPFLGARCAALTTVLMAWLTAEAVGESIDPARGLPVGRSASDTAGAGRSEPGGHPFSG